MALKIRQKKASNSSQHPRYTTNTGRNWADQYREENQDGFRKSFIAIVVVMIAIVVILILAAVTSVIQPSETNQQISAADTFAVSSYEQEQMVNTAKQFADGILVYAYCSDDEVARQGKSAALQTIARNSSIYNNIEKLEQTNPVIAPDDFAPVTTDPKIQDPSRAYVGTFTYEFDGVAADMSKTNEANPHGTFADNGYHFVVTFSYATDSATGESAWIISDARIKAKS